MPGWINRLGIGVFIEVISEETVLEVCNHMYMYIYTYINLYIYISIYIYIYMGPSINYIRIFS